ncbi:hypothetical protein [Microbacterium algeriense]|uniref:hypothetical protein n=1 Tax=Microbacterium algeriense TaxID=2615184 RepID=UPI0022E525D6|nr:hypothetical protein [Microbacterium algeriense]
MSEPVQPPAAHLPAAPQYPAAPPYPGPGHPQAHPAAPPYPGPGHPQQAYATTPAAGTGNPLGRAAFIIAIVTLAINLFSSLARPYFYTASVGYDAVIVLDNLIGVASFFVYGLALVLGFIAVRRATAHLLAGIAIGVAGAGMIGLAFTWITVTLYRFL